ncbi:sulfatase-like hydrolase/transferase [Sphingobium estronivorans]|uniref:sulfatase-like hydrolase/transferase n=1 Tax=Sphingobium estronivorans TaxID=1577690 RepID=UPI001F082495|nr:sulfatase-like hydrolase/transferase [Sphingobium estronivorans]
MDRRSFVQAIGTAGALAALGGNGLAMARSSVKRPNIIFIMADDLGYADLSCTGSSHIRTPAIDSIARRGVQLRQGYANSAICSSTRTALLTGCYQQRFAVGLEEPIALNAPPGIGVPRDRPTIASALRDTGYATHLIGKWHLGEPPDHGPLSHGYDSFFGIVEGASDYFRHKIVIEGKEIGFGLTEGNVPVAQDGYLTDVLGDRAVRIVEQAAGKPFFMSLHFTAPHWPWEGREDAALARTLESSFHYDGGNLATYKAMVEAMDQNVGKLLGALERTGQLDNSILVFTSDNGGERFSQTWPFTGIKGELLEGGIRVPLLVSWPGQITAGSHSEQMMISMDFLPTLLAMAGGNPATAGRFDGMDLSKQLLGKAPLVDRTLYWRFKAGEQAAIREGNWKYLKLRGREMLFDFSADERERANLFDAHPDMTAALKRKWDSWNAQMLPYRVDGYSEDVTKIYPDRF